MDTQAALWDDRVTPASRDKLPLSVDQRNSFAESTVTGAGTQSTHSVPPSSPSSPTQLYHSSGASNHDNGIDENLPNALPTSTDDVMMPTHVHTGRSDPHSSSSTSSATNKHSQTTNPLYSKAELVVIDSIAEKLHSVDRTAGEKNDQVEEQIPALDQTLSPEERASVVNP